MARHSDLTQTRALPRARVRRAFACRPTEPRQLGVREMEAVHRHDDGLLPERVGQRVRQRRLAAARCTGDAEHAPAARREQGHRPVNAFGGNRCGHDRHTKGRAGPLLR